MYCGFVPFICIFLINVTHSSVETYAQKVVPKINTSASLFSEATEEEAQEMTPSLVNGSPKLPRLPMPSVLDHESFDITLHRKDTEGFGFVILTSKSKPPYGGESVNPDSVL